MPLGQFLSSRDRYEEAEVVFQDGYARLQSKPAAPPEWAGGLARELAGLYRRWGKLERAEEWGGKALAMFRKQCGDDHEATACLAHSLAFDLMRNPGREAEAEQLYREALQLRRRILGEGNHATADTAFRLAEALGAQRKFDEAETLLREAHAALAANRASDPAREFEPVLLQWIIQQYRAWGQLERAAEWERRRSAKEEEKKKLEPESK